MRDSTNENAILAIQRAYDVNIDTATETFSAIECVINAKLYTLNKNYSNKDVENVNKHILKRLLSEKENQSSVTSTEALMVQTHITNMVSDVVLQYARNVYYAKSTLVDILRDMNVDVTGAEAYLEDLSELLSPSEKCVLRLMCGEGCTLMQTSEVLGVSPQEVRTLHRRAYAFLRQEWLALCALSASDESTEQ